MVRWFSYYEECLCTSFTRQRLLVLVIERKESSIEEYRFSLFHAILDVFLLSKNKYIRSVDLLELGTPIPSIVFRILHDLSWLYCKRIVRTNTALDFIDRHSCYSTMKCEEGTEDLREEPLMKRSLFAPRVAVAVLSNLSIGTPSLTARFLQLTNPDFVAFLCN